MKFDPLDILTEALKAVLLESKGRCLKMNNQEGKINFDCPTCILNNAIKYLTEQDMKTRFTPEDEKILEKLARGEYEV